MTKNSKELLIFNYAPNLKVVGTFHSLNDQDKRTLEHLVDESDFVALEWDEFRSNANGRFFLLYSEDKKNFSTDEEAVYCGYWDFIYLITLRRATVREIKKDCKKEERDCEQDEFTFCEKLCKTREKDVYLVDQPINITYEKMCSLPFKDKILELINHTFKTRFKTQYDCIVIDDRNEYMLQEIERNEECSILELKRKGLLVVGYSHAVKYWKDVQATS